MKNFKIFCKSFPLTSLIFLVILMGFTTSFALKTPNENDLIERFERKESIIEVHFIDVGYGESTLIKTENKNILIDGGEKNSLVDYLDNLRIETIDILIVTNPASPYINSLPAVINNYEINKIIDSGFALNTDNYKEYLTAVEENKQTEKFSIVRRNMKESIDNEVELEILSPGKELFTDPRNNSLVFLLTFKEISLLHTGAIGKQREIELINDNDIFDKIKNTNILKISRMGSAHSNHKDFIKAVNPHVAVFTVGDTNPKNLPDASVIDKLEDMNIHRERVDQQGNIVFYSNGKQIKWDQ